MKRILLLLLILFARLIFSQSAKQTELYKSKFFLYPTIGTDSALIYVDKIFTSNKPVDLAFAYTAKRHLLTLTGKNNDEKKYLSKIYSYLKTVPKTENNFTDLSNIYNILGNTDRANEKYDKALNNFYKAETYAEKKNDIKQIIKIKGNVALVKGNKGFLDDAIAEIKYVLLLLEENKKIYDNDYYKINFYNQSNNLGNFYLKKYKLNKNKIYIDSAQAIYEDMLMQRLTPIQKAYTHENLGTLYGLKEDYTASINYFKKALQYFILSNTVQNINSTKYNIAYIYYEQKKYDDAKKYFISLIESGQETPGDFSYLFSHQYLAKIYIAENKKDSANYYLNTFLELYDKRSETEKKQFADVYKSIENKDVKNEIKKIKNENSSLKNNLFFYIIIALVAVSVLSFAIYYQVKKKKFAEKNMEELLKRINNKESNKIKEESFSGTKITDEKEQEIINGLIKLEKEEYFLKQEFNLYNAAKKIGTNTTYLSKVIKSYKNISFNDYTNELRINYIVDLLMKDKKIRNYTMQSLAELAGYKNGSSFSKIFKEKTGVTPFQLIEKINS